MKDIKHQVILESEDFESLIDRAELRNNFEDLVKSKLKTVRNKDANVVEFTSNEVIRLLNESFPLIRFNIEQSKPIDFCESCICNDCYIRNSCTELKGCNNCKTEFDGASNYNSECDSYED